MVPGNWGSWICNGRGLDVLMLQCPNVNASMRGYQKGYAGRMILMMLSMFMKTNHS